MGRPQLRRADEPVHVRRLSRPGSSYAAFAVESLLDELAAELGLDPVELRLKNACIEGDRGMTGPVPTFGAVEVLEATPRTSSGPRDSLPEGEGIGVAAGYWPGGNEPTAAVCRVDTDGTMTVVTSAVDMTGVNTGFATIAAAAFGLPREGARGHGRPPGLTRAPAAGPR